MFILKKGHQPGVCVPLRALFLVFNALNFYHLKAMDAQVFLRSLSFFLIQ